MVLSPSKHVSGLAAAEAHVGSVGRFVSVSGNHSSDEEEQHPLRTSLGDESERGCVFLPALIHDPCCRSPLARSAVDMMKRSSKSYP
jgi:hypothetical protein